MAAPNAPAIAWHQPQGDKVTPRDLERVQSAVRDALARVDNDVQGVADDLAAANIEIGKRAEWVSPPANAGSPGTPGQIAYDYGSNYFYVCIITNGWGRVLLSTVF